MDMQEKNEELVNRFLRTFTHYFSLKDMTRIFLSFGIKAKSQEVRHFLEASPYVFSLEKEMFITKAGAFTNKLFCIYPTAKEFEKKTLVIGDRCLPFVNTELAPSAVRFYCDGKKLKPKVASFDSQTLLSFYSLFGEEYAFQYVAADPANENLSLSLSEEEIPSTLSVTGFDLTFLIEKYGFSKGDRLLCSVSDWDNCCVKVSVCHEDNNFVEGKSSDERVKWYSQLEEFLLDSFDRYGPCDSIESQLERVFFEHAEKLCICQCGSISEYVFRHAKNVSIEYFGVETRLWKKGQTVPAVGPWNMGDFVDLKKKNVKKEGFWATPYFIFDQYILDMLFRREEDCSLIIPRMYPSEKYLNENYREELLLLLKSRSDILCQDYNWFADRSFGKLRQKALELYTKVAELVFKIDSFATGLDSFPQQELVILSQLYSHIIRLLQMIAEGPDLGSEVSDFILSVEGMNWNFEEVRGVLEEAVDKNRHKGFKVIKGAE